MASKPTVYRLAVCFESMEDLKAFAERVSTVGVGVYKADSLDPEYNGNAPRGSFVIRSIKRTDKPQEWRVA